MLKCLSCLVSAENNNNKHYCLKSLRKNLQWLQVLYRHVYACIGSWENGNRYPPRQDAVYTSPHGGQGGPRGGNFQGGGVTFLDVFFSRDFETRIIVFIDDLTLTVSWLFFFTAFMNIVYVNVNVIGSWIMPVIQVIALFHYINALVVFTHFMSCSISLLLTCF